MATGAYDPQQRRSRRRNRIGNGIQVVNAINGGTQPIRRALSCFSGEARAGTPSTTISGLRGGVGGSSPNDWFLRSTFESWSGAHRAAVSDFRSRRRSRCTAGHLADHRPGACDLWRGAADGAAARCHDWLGIAVHERIGDTLTLANSGGDSAGWNRADWGRFFGQADRQPLSGNCR